MKLGAVIIPATTLLTPDDLADRLERGDVRHVVVGAGQRGKFAGARGELHPDRRRRAGRRAGSTTPAAYDAPADVHARRPDAAPTDPLLLYFTSGTTAKPKLVVHTHQSYPVGHLSTMYWIGLQPGDVHLNISSPGWAKHAWSSFFAPWNAEATVLVRLRRALQRHGAARRARGDAA